MQTCYYASSIPPPTTETLSLIVGLEVLGPRKRIMRRIKMVQYQRDAQKFEACFMRAV